jgi:hypothetical protein
LSKLKQSHNAEEEALVVALEALGEEPRAITSADYTLEFSVFHTTTERAHCSECHVVLMAMTIGPGGIVLVVLAGFAVLCEREPFTRITNQAINGTLDALEKSLSKERN